MLYALPDGVGGISIAGRSFEIADDGTIDIPDDIARDHADHIAAHGVVAAPAVTVADDDDPDTMTRPALFSWLKAHGVKAFRGADDASLRAKVRDAQASASEGDAK